LLKRDRAYINHLNKNSFYLLDVLNKLKAAYKYDFLGEAEVVDAQALIKMSIAKHSGSRRVGRDVVKKIPDSFLPERVVEDEKN